MCNNMHVNAKIKHIIEKIRISVKKEANKKPIVISGSPRTGSTWFMEILSYFERTYSIFEPLHPSWFEDADNLDIGFRPYIDPDQENPDFKQFLNYIFEGGRISNNPHFDYSQIYSRFKGDVPVIKFVRANRALQWIAKKMELNSCFLLIRHPCATISSQLKTGYTGYIDDSYSKNIIPSKSDIIKDIREIDIIPNEKIDIVKNAKNKIEILSIIYSLDYYIPLYYLDKYKINLVTYEDLLLNPKETIKDISAITGLDYDKRKILKNVVKPSQMTEQEKINRKHQLSKWRNNLKERQINSIFNIVRSFDVKIYGDSLTPNTHGFDTV